jgi:hypothetical protein
MSELVTTNHKIVTVGNNRAIAVKKLAHGYCNCLLSRFLSHNDRGGETRAMKGGGGE